MQGVEGEDRQLSRSTANALFEHFEKQRERRVLLVVDA